MTVFAEVENLDHSIHKVWNLLDKKYGAIHKFIYSVLSDIKELPLRKYISSLQEMQGGLSLFF